MDENLFVQGKIFDIQRFSVHDGPGIRTIVFLKGCPLRCKWCCNPEGQEYKDCVMTLGGKTKNVGKITTVAEVMETVEKDRGYYLRSGGGLTLSGGECLTQPDFAVALLKTAKDRAINTAIETTGYADFSVIERYLPYVDTFLMDIKHINSEKHKAFTGVDNSRILENAKKIASSNKVNYIVRTPVIPTFNATEEEIGEIAKFASEIGAKEMHILPYHRIGTDKYKGLGRDYLLSEIEPPSKETMQRLLDVVKAYGLKCQIGG